MQTRMVQLFGRQVITPGTIPFAALQLSELPFDVLHWPLKTSIGPEIVPVHVVPVVETKNMALLHEDRMSDACAPTSGGLPVAQPSRATRSDRLGPQPTAPPSGIPPSGPASVAPPPPSLTAVLSAGIPRAGSVCV
jgi:hypothetical protein